MTPFPQSLKAISQTFSILVVGRGLRAPLQPVLKLHVRSTSSKPQFDDIAKALSTPSWSVSSLLHSPTEDGEQPRITIKQLHHLLRLSALPIPSSSDDEDAMLRTLSSQLHFVQNIQNVDTEGVEPLRSVSDTTAEGMKELEIKVEDMEDALQGEELVQFANRTRWKTKGSKLVDIGPRGSLEGLESWKPLRLASRKDGNFFVVDVKDTTSDRSGK